MGFGYFAILLGFVILIVLSLCNVSVFISSIVASIAVILLTGLPFTDTFINVYFVKFGEFIATMLPLYIFGAVIAQIYVSTGAARSISDSICNALFRVTKTETSRHAFGFLSVIISSAVLCFGGINAAVAIITIYPIAANIFERAGIPRRFIMGAICGGAFTFSLSGPGSPQPTNVVGVTLLGASPSSGLIAGIVGAIIEVIVMVVLLTKMCEKAVSAGESFSYGENESVYIPTQGKQPNLAQSLIPLVVLVVIFNVFSLNVFTATLLTAILAIVLLFPHLPKGSILSVLNEGATSSIIPAATIGAINGFAAIIQQTPSYSGVVDALLGMKLAPVLLLILTIAFMCCLTGGSTTGTTIAFPVIAPALLEKGLSVAFIHRVGVFAATMIDSLPHSGAVLMAINVAKLKMRDAYPAVFVSTVLATTCGTIAVALIMYLFPFLP